MRLVTGEELALTTDELIDFAKDDMTRHFETIRNTTDADAPGATGTLGFAEGMARCSTACSDNPSFRRMLADGLFSVV